MPSDILWTLFVRFFNNTQLITRPSLPFIRIYPWSIREKMIRLIMHEADLTKLTTRSTEWIQIYLKAISVYIDRLKHICFSNFVALSRDYKLRWPSLWYFLLFVSKPLSELADWSHVFYKNHYMAWHLGMDLKKGK